MNCWNGKMKRSSITLTYSSWRFKTVTSAPKALKSAIIASRARLSGLGGVLLAPCSSVGGRRGHGSRSRPQVGAAGHGCRFPPSIDARLSRRRAQHGLLRAPGVEGCTGAWPPLRTVTRARLAPTSRTSTTRTTWCCCRICGAGVETKRGSRPRWLEPHTSDAPSRTSIAVRFWLAWSSGQARRVWTVRDRRV